MQVLSVLNRKFHMSWSARRAKCELVAYAASVPLSCLQCAMALKIEWISLAIIIFMLFINLFLFLSLVTCLIRMLLGKLLKFNVDFPGLV